MRMCLLAVTASAQLSAAFSKKCLAAFMGGMIYIKSDYSRTPNHLRVHIKNTSRAAESLRVTDCSLAGSYGYDRGAVRETREQINKLCTQHTHTSCLVWKKRQ